MCQDLHAFSTKNITKATIRRVAVLPQQYVTIVASKKVLKICTLYIWGELMYTGGPWAVELI